MFLSKGVILLSSKWCTNGATLPNMVRCTFVHMLEESMLILRGILLPGEYMTIYTIFEQLPKP